MLERLGTRYRWIRNHTIKLDAERPIAGIELIERGQIAVADRTVHRQKQDHNGLGIARLAKPTELTVQINTLQGRSRAAVLRSDVVNVTQANQAADQDKPRAYRSGAKLPFRGPSKDVADKSRTYG